ncbi:hypothetical protein CPB86DRAFT_97461 [Serendipita vermifera]|nr:hypothetical protein CPB86DRAFT_97461 [Serendipita vermifera]
MLPHVSKTANMLQELVLSRQKLGRFKAQWETFIEGLAKEWETMNIMSALLLGVILTLFQIGEATFEPVTRTAAFLSLISALVSLISGIMFIVQFRTMRYMSRAATWLRAWLQRQIRGEENILWNVWVLLAMPAIWLAYSLTFFFVTLTSFLWTSGTGKHLNPMSNDEKSAVILVPRILTKILLLLGLIYIALVFKTFYDWSLLQISGLDSLDKLPNKSAPGDYGKNNAKQNDKLTEIAKFKRSKKERARSTSDLEWGRREPDDLDVDRYPVGNRISPPVDQSNRLQKHGVQAPTPEPLPPRASLTVLSNSAKSGPGSSSKAYLSPLPDKGPDKSFVVEDSEPIRLNSARDNGPLH